MLLELEDWGPIYYKTTAKDIQEDFLELSTSFQDPSPTDIEATSTDFKLTVVVLSVLYFHKVDISSVFEVIDALTKNKDDEWLKLFKLEEELAEIIERPIDYEEIYWWYEQHLSQEDKEYLNEFIFNHFEMSKSKKEAKQPILKYLFTINRGGRSLTTIQLPFQGFADFGHSRKVGKASCSLKKTVYR